jgi:hypothetical protein
MRKICFVLCGLWIWAGGASWVMADQAYQIARERKKHLQEESNTLEKKIKKIERKKRIADLDAEISQEMMKKTQDPAKKKALNTARNTERTVAMMLGERKKRFGEKKEELREAIQDQDETLKNLSGGNFKSRYQHVRPQKDEPANNVEQTRETLENRRIKIRQKILKGLRES